MPLLPRHLPGLLSCRRFSSSSPTAIAAAKKRVRRYPQFSNIRSEYKSRAVEEGQKALREYLHRTKSIPFVFAEQIANNSLVSLSKLLQKLPSSNRAFSRSFQNLLRYEPINEFEFFLESIGIHPSHAHRFLPPGKLFFSDDGSVICAACALSLFGFPWNSLGKLYREEVSIFRNSSDVLTDRLCSLKDRYKIDSLCVVGVCLAYPRFLSSESEFGFEIDAVLSDLKRVFAESEKGSRVEGNVEAWFELCCKVRTFHDLGCEKGTVGEAICGSDLLLQCPREVLTQKVEYFLRFGASDIEIGTLLLRNPEILGLDLDTPVISVSRLFEHFGLDAEGFHCLKEKYPHVMMGRNKMGNLPNVAKASNLHAWCFEMIKRSNGRVLSTFVTAAKEEERDGELVIIGSAKSSALRASKLEFLKGIGFGENAETLKLLENLHGNGANLRQRFDFFIGLGFKHAEVCSMIKRAPHIICQSPEKLEGKIAFLRREMGCSLDFVVGFPRFLHFDLDARIKRRHRFYVWMSEKGLYTKKYSISHMLKSNDKSFVERLLRIHPASPKQYLECF